MIPFDKWNIKHQNQTEKDVLEVTKLFNELLVKIGLFASSVTLTQDIFKFRLFPALQKKVDDLLQKHAFSVESLIEKNVASHWELSQTKNDTFEKKAFKKYKTDPIPTRNAEGLKAFRNRKNRKLSSRVWKQTQQLRNELEMAIDTAIKNGTPANKLATEIKKYLNEPDKLFRKYRDNNGQLQLSKNAKAYKPGQGVYRSSFKNAQRLARTEINIAYRLADIDRWSNMKYVVGYEIKRSNNPYPCPICEMMKGSYPKNFVWSGNHPNCYSDDSEVYTNQGWKYFKDVNNKDKILSLNPETKNLEYVDILLNFRHTYNGKMAHFHSKTLDCLVTLDHEMLYMNKSNGEFRRVKAKDYTKGKGAIYRSSEYAANDVDVIEIGNKTFNFDAFCQFMGYYLSDGSLIRKSQIKIAQQDDNRKNIAKTILKLGLEPKYNKESVDCYNSDLNSYLKGFGVCNEKYIPNEIKNASPRQIKLFLDAFISCDGHIRPLRSRKKKDGSIITQKNNEKSYFTTSKQMADDLGELILKIGKRPSFAVKKVKGTDHKFKNGTYTLNHDIIVISELVTTSAAYFKKDYVDYNGYVYDLTLSKNSTMYIRRNGKCFWGSNCRCYLVPIMQSEDDFVNSLKTGKTETKQTPVNPKFLKWIKENRDKIKSAKTIPYFIKDNPKYI